MRIFDLLGKLYSLFLSFYVNKSSIVVNMYNSIVLELVFSSLFFARDLNSNPIVPSPVSYTHLTLPTIYSV